MQMRRDYRLFIQESRGNRPLDYSASSAFTFFRALSEGFFLSLSLFAARFSYELLDRFSHRFVPTGNLNV